MEIGFEAGGGGCLMTAIKIDCYCRGRWPRSDSTSYRGWRHVIQVHPEHRLTINGVTEGKRRRLRVKGMLAPWTLALLGREVN